jgi:3-hydroxyisobutyrate dehydrogenase-like beta-hydroxyacid dehydrogenase
VPATGLRTPVLLSGPGATRLAPILAGLGMPVEVVSDRPGDAAERKLLRSVFMKGLAAVVGEALEAGRRLGFEDWLLGQIEDELGRADGSLVTRFEQGTRRHAPRRVVEMAAAVELLEEHGLHAEVTRATLARLARLAETGLDER